MPPSNTHEYLLERLKAVPGRIAQAIAGRNNHALFASSQQWSVAEIVAHLRASDDIMSHRLYAILARDNTPLIAYDERRWAEIAGYTKVDPHESLATWAKRRAETVAMLNRASADDWLREGVHEVHGAQTLFAVVAAMLEHEEQHCRQLETLAFNNR